MHLAMDPLVDMVGNSSCAWLTRRLSVNARHRGQGEGHAMGGGGRGAEMAGKRNGRIRLVLQTPTGLLDYENRNGQILSSH